jgi:acyl carrier protein
MTQTVKDRVIAIIAEQAVLEPEQVSPEMTLADLGIDSLGLVESIFAIEESFDVTVPFNANEPGESTFDISSVAAIITAVEALVAEKV